MAAVASEIGVEILGDYSLRSIGRLSNELKADHVVVPDGDAVAFELAKGRRWPGRGSLTALVMREKGQPSKIPGGAALKTFAKIALLQLANLRPEVEIRILKSAPWRGFSFLPVSRDPVSLCSTSTKSNRINCRVLPEGPYWFGVVGSVGHRKNLPLVAAALAALDCADVGLAVAGRIEEGVLNRAQPFLDRIQANGGQVKVIDRLLDDLEMDNFVVELDCVVLAHSNDGPSGILGKAVAAGTSIVAAGAPTLRADCRQVGSSAEWVRLTEKQLSKAFARATKKPRPQPDLLSSPAEFAWGLLGEQP
ncbi:hypothetical protein AHiyo6_01350 [Arthrobacter sp. Hiyo6]|nr:hypothetical protein AHiyo6_01350 [Arthrobacter sp. Hiyo6]